ncbi:MAG: CPBP family intramembrane metalloprotease [Terrimicrobiaceae bacterium]|nr:CPBP family intramembrane metalloprotease [Terrimicrobiaceae bacterium]
MNPLAKISLYLAAVVLLAALLSPPFYWVAQSLAAAHPALAGIPFHRFFSRIAQIAALVLLWPALRWLNLRRPTELGLARNPHAVRDVIAGLVLALLPLIALAAVYFQCDIYRLRQGVAWPGLGRIAATAIFVSLLEEALFRGVLLGLAIRSLGRWTSVLLVSAAFSAIHFIKPRGNVADVGWGSGFALLGSVFSPAAGPAVTFAGAAALFVIGIILAFATLRTRSLWLPIGLHAGWILGQQTINLLGKYRVKPPDALLPWVGPNVVSGMVPTGLVPLAALLVSGLLVWWYLARGSRSIGEPAPAPAHGAG